MVDLTLIAAFSIFVLVFVGNGRGLVHPHSEILCGASLPGAFFVFVLNVTLVEKHVFNDLSMIVHQNDTNLLSTLGTINKTCIQDPIKFWWVL